MFGCAGTAMSGGPNNRFDPLGIKSDALTSDIFIGRMLEMLIG